MKLPPRHSEEVCRMRGASQKRLSSAVLYPYSLLSVNSSLLVFLVASHELCFRFTQILCIIEQVNK